MHEAVIADELLRQVLSAVEPRHASSVDQVSVRIGALRPIVPDALQMAFAAAAWGTIAQEADLQVAQERVLSVCRHCGWMFAPKIEGFDFRCPNCHESDARIIAGDDIVLVSVLCHTDEEVGG